MKVQFPVTSKNEEVIFQYGVENLKYEEGISRRNGVIVYGFYKGDAKNVDNVAILCRKEVKLSEASDKSMIIFSLLLPELENAEFFNGYKHKDMGKTNEEMKEVIRDYNLRNGIEEKPEVKHREVVKTQVIPVTDKPDTPDINSLLTMQRMMHHGSK